MAALSDSVIVSVGGRIHRITPPDAGLAMALGSWGNQSKLVNGANAVVGSAFAARSYTLSWSVLEEPEFLKIQEAFAFAGEDTVLYRDLFHGTDRYVSNAASPLLGRPHLLADSFSPVAFDNFGTVLASSTRVPGDPGRALSFTGTQATDGQAHAYTEQILVPGGYDVYVRAHGTGDFGQMVAFNGGNLSGTVRKAAIPTDSVVPLTITATGGSAVLHWISVALVPGAIQAPTMETYRPPVGVGPLRVVPGSFNTTGITAAYGKYSCTVDLVEVWPWL